MKIDLNLNPQIAAQAIVSVAHTDEIFWFVGNAIERYFTRLVQFTDMNKLVECGLRPVVSPVAAEEALRRGQHATSYTAAWVHALIANDAEAARLALRAVAYYAKRYAAADLALVSDEVGETAMQMKAAAKFLQVAFDISQFEV